MPAAFFCNFKFVEFRKFPEFKEKIRIGKTKFVLSARLEFIEMHKFEQSIELNKFLTEKVLPRSKDQKFR